MIKKILKEIGLPVAYGRFRGAVDPPFICYLGSGQYKYAADDTVLYKDNGYQIEYYFVDKDEAKEESIENAFLSNGYIYEKSEDVYISDEDIFVIYYTI